MAQRGSGGSRVGTVGPTFMFGRSKSGEGYVGSKRSQPQARLDTPGF